MTPNINPNDKSIGDVQEPFEKIIAPQAGPRKYEISYLNVLTFSYGHASAIYGLYLGFTAAKWQTLCLGYVLLIMSIVGVTGGAHRLWSHRSYKAKLPLQIILMVMQSIASEYSITNWVRDHRLHHKYSDTDADPHNATRGFFYSHIGWLLVGKHPEVKERGKYIDMSDIYENPVLRFQKKYAVPFIGMMCFGLPNIVPMYCWGETFNNSWHINLFRYVFSLHLAFLINSVAHLWGMRPYDTTIMPSDNVFFSMLTCGEGFHNYHHVFPWDYRTAEFGYNKFSITTKFIEFFAWIGWAYDMKTVSNEMLESRIKRTGSKSKQRLLHSD